MARFGPLSEIMISIEGGSEHEWLYLPVSGQWSLTSNCMVSASEVVLPEDEDRPNAGVPQAAKDAGLMQVVPVGVMKEIIGNAKAQRPSASSDELFAAFMFYWSNDAFIRFQD